jgi:adenine-specific DNA-methyltransferase
MNFKALESRQKLRGGFYTDPLIASFLVKWIKAANPSSILEPSCGDGIFLQTIEQQRIASLKQVTACEIEPEEVEKARNRTQLPVRVLNCDFLKWFLFTAEKENRFDAVVGNPPFIRYQYLAEEQQLLAEKIFAQLRLPFTKHSNAWVPFVLASIRLLNPGGRIAMVIPSEIFHIPHAASLRRYIVAQCAKVLVVDPTELWFGETLQGTVLLLAEKKHHLSERSRGIGIISISNRQRLSQNPEHLFRHATYINDRTIQGKWMQIFLTAHERALLARMRELPGVACFSQIASVDVGIVTGANKFFLVPDSTVKEFGLQRWSYPMFGRSDHVEGLIFSTSDYERNRSIGLPSNFLWFQEKNIEDLPTKVRRYLEIGLRQELPSRFKCRTRKSWFEVPSVYSAPIAMLKRAHNYPRLVLNKAEAYTTDTAYRIRPLGVKPAPLVLGFVNSLTCLTAELEGRHYGGGVLELVPSEIERLLVPLVQASASDLVDADRRFRKSTDALSFLREQDSLILGSIGVTEHEQCTLHAAWLKLRDRRHRFNCEERH